MKKTLITFACLVISSYNIFAQCLSGDCVNGFGKIKYNDGSSYEGTFKNKLSSGLGIVSYPNGNYYFGQMIVGRLDGFGTLYFKDQQHFFGKWQNSKQQGIGIYNDAKGIPTAGNWEMGTFMTAKNTEVQTSNPKNCIGNCVNGYGRITNKDGSFIQAIFENGIPTFGQIKNVNFTYDGEIKNNLANGYGQISYSNGDHYFGFFKEGKKHGKGILSPKGKERLYGEWINDELYNLKTTDFCNEIIQLASLTAKEVISLPIEKKDAFSSETLLKSKFFGLFELTRSEAVFSEAILITISFPKSDTNIPEVSFTQLKEALDLCESFEKKPYLNAYYLEKNYMQIKNIRALTLEITYPYVSCVLGDCKSGFGKKEFLNGDIYEGNFQNGLFDGKGSIFFVNGNSYIGNFVKGIRQGKGKFTWSKGDSYEGDWVEGQKTGNGVYIWANGSKYEGGWIDNSRTGKGTFTYTNGSKYIGNFKDGLFEGSGKLYGPNEALINDGLFQKGKFIEKQ